VLHSKSLSIEYQIIRAGQILVHETWSKKHYSFADHRFYYVLSGEALLKTLDKQIVLQPGYLYFIPAYCIVESECKKSLDHLYIHFTSDSKKIQWMFSNLMAQGLRVEDRVIGLFESCIRYTKDKRIHHYFKAQGSLAILTSYFLKDGVQKDFERHRLKETLQYLDENYFKALDIEYLAKREGLDPVYFANLFSSTVGMPINQYLIKKRIESAQNFLTNTDYKVYEISVKVGIEDPYYFSRLFKKKTGETPLAFRNRIRS
tara:strand:+ start:2130 stop:2909 length:780 start_codon:yes stop_codon:yes gene_type:complete